MNRNHSWMYPVIFTAMVLLTAPPVPAQDAETLAADYEMLTNWEFSANAVALPSEGIHFESDTAEWFFDTGTVRPMRPTSGGSVTGLVFEGEGRFKMAIPDRVEANQVARFTVTPGEAMRRIELPPTDTLEYTFRRMVLRTTAERVMSLFPAASGETFEKNKLARHRRLWWLQYARFDVDARVIAGLLNQDNEYLAVDMETDEHGWLFYEFEPWRMEEIRLCRMSKSFDFVEVWVSLDRAEHRRPDGRPGNILTPLIDLVHADLEVDLMKHKGRAGQEISRKNWSLEYPLTSFRARMEFASEVDGLQALPLRLNPWSNKVTATDSAGRALPVLRAPFGRLFPMIRPEEEDLSLVVILHQTLARGESEMINFTWQRQTSNYPGINDAQPVYDSPTTDYLDGGGQDWYPPFRHRSGRYWYPEPLGERDDPHTARVTIIHPKKLGVRATGAHTGGSTEGRRVIEIWESDVPLKAAGFSYGHGYKERRILLDGLPEVIGFGANRLQQMGDTVEAAAAHMADSIQFYQDIFEYPLPLDTVTGTRVNGGSQTYSGFIAYGDHTFDLASSWDSEWSMAKRTAELFWGGLLDWESYRDRWLVDALAGYSSMMYLEVITEGWGRMQRGSIKSYEEFIRLRQRRLAYANSYRFERLGPLDVSFRDRIPGVISGGYNKSKGMAVLHMLRGILTGQSEDGELLFNAILADFLKAHAGKTASTRDFIATVERMTGEDWGWFFDQWVYGMDIPTYIWSHEVTQEPAADGLYELKIKMEQRGVSPGFRMPVTFGLEYGNADPEVLHLELDQPAKTFTLRLPNRPVKVTFDPYHDLLYVME